jgi:hypothetical protein
VWISFALLTIPGGGGRCFLSVIPITLIAFMESYSIARNIAGQRNELHYLSATQEMWANGIGNMVAAGSSGYPVSGSFSRSALVSALPSLHYPSLMRLTSLSECTIRCSDTSLQSHHPFRAVYRPEDAHQYSSLCPPGCSERSDFPCYFQSNQCL